MTSQRYRMTVIHSVPNFERWRTILTDNPSEGRPGLLKRSVFRSLDDPNEIMVEVEFATAEAAKGFLTTLDLRDLLDRAGIEVYPPVFIGEEVEDLAFEAR